MKKIIAVLLVCIALVSVIGCTTGEKTPEKAKIGVVVPDLNNAFCTDMDNGIKRAAKEKG